MSKTIAFISSLVLLVSTSAFAQEGATAVAATANGGWTGSETAFKFFAYFLALGLAVYGGTTGQSKAAAVALEGIARNPAAADKIQTPMIIALALMESLVIFALISSKLV